MDTQKAQRLARLSNQLAEALMTAALCAQEIRSEARAELEEGGAATPPRAPPPERGTPRA